MILKYANGEFSMAADDSLLQTMAPEMKCPNYCVLPPHPFSSDDQVQHMEDDTSA